MICGFFMDGKQHNPLIILIGPMGAGKTTIGKLLAQQLGFDFYDTDQEVERLSGASVSWIFEKEGEIGFRARESRVLDRLTRMNQVVLATGGGAVTTLENHAYLKRGIIIYLRAEVDIQYERTCRDKNRPLLQTENPKQKLQALFEKRDPIYQQLADITVVTGHFSPKKMIQDILAKLQKIDDINDMPTLTAEKSE